MEREYYLFHFNVFAASVIDVYISQLSTSDFYEHDHFNSGNNRPTVSI